MIFLVVKSIVSPHWFWFGTKWQCTLIRFGILVIGLTLTRLIRIHPVIRSHLTRKWIWILLYPWYLFLMFWVRIYAIITMNKHGWITRRSVGPGGF
jgi:hypothetical protein